MKYVITRLEPWQNAKVLSLVSAMVFFVVLLPFVVVGAIAEWLTGPPGSSILQLFLSLILMPVVYGVIALVAVLVGCFAYNMLLDFTGGIQFSFAEKSADIPEPSSTEFIPESEQLESEVDETAPVPVPPLTPSA